MRLTALLAIALLAPAMAAPAASASPRHRPSVWTLSCDGGEELLPETLQISCEGAAPNELPVKHMRWLTYGHAVARALGVVELCLLNPRQATVPPRQAWQLCSGIETPEEHFAHWLFTEPIQWRLSHPVRCRARSEHVHPRTRRFYGVSSYQWGEEPWRSSSLNNGYRPANYRCPRV